MPVPVVEYGGAVLINGKRYIVVPNPSEPSVEPLLVHVELPVQPGLYAATTGDGKELLLTLDTYGKWSQLDLISSRHGGMTPTGLANLHGWRAIFISEPRP